MPTAQSSSSSSKQQSAQKGRSISKETSAEMKKLSISKDQLEEATTTGKSTPTSDQQAASAATASASSSGNKTPPEQPEFVKQVLIIIEKKVRNLEKRRQKLDEYKETQRKGTVLNEDQLSAVSRYDEVQRNLELTREMEKQFMTLASEATKQQKKQAKRDQIEREEAIRDAVRDKLREANKYLSVLTSLRSDNVRSDFLKKKNNATLVTDTEISTLDTFDKLVNLTKLDSNFDAHLNESVDHLLNFIDAKEKQVPSMDVSYSELKVLFDKIYTSPYWQKRKESKAKVDSENEQKSKISPSKTTSTKSTETKVKSPVKHEEKIEKKQPTTELTINEQQPSIPVQKQQQQQQEQQPMYVTQESATVDDYILVSSTSECSKQQYQQQQQHKPTYFTTLNPTDLATSNENINEFLNRCENNDEGINFIQVSEIQSQVPQQQQQQVSPQQSTQEQQFVPNQGKY
jgi:hypothetical protein